MADLNTITSQVCPVIGSQVATVCLPVCIKPYVTTGPTVVQCCGDTCISHCYDQCKGKINGCCDFTIIQKIRIDVPVEFGATVKVGDTYVDCLCCEHVENTNEAAFFNFPEM